MRARHEAAAAQPREAAGGAADRHLGEAGQLAAGPRPHLAAARRPGSTAPSPARRRRPPAPSPSARDVADIAVERRLPPGEAVRPLLVDGEGLAVARSCVARSAAGSAATRQVEQRHGDPPRLAGGVARRLHLPAQVLGREVGPRRAAAAREQIVRFTGSAPPGPRGSPAPPGTPRPSAGPAWPPASSRRCRRAGSAALAVTKRRRNSAAVIAPAMPPEGALSRSAMPGSISGS